MGWSDGVDLLDSVLTILPIIGIPFGDKQNIKLNILNGQQFVSLNNLNKQLILKQAIDRDTGLTNINVLIECVPLIKYFNQSSEYSENIFSLNINVFISIIDVNDNPPKFTKNGKFDINLHEELPIGTKINLDFKAVDNDQPGPNSHIRYKIIETISSSTKNKNYSNLFSIPDPFLPELFISDRIDFENMPSRFSIKIEAEDQGIPKLNSSAVIEVNLEDIDDLNPIFSSSIYKAKKSNFNSTLLIIEPKPIKAWDGDSFNETILYKLSGENSKYFIIDEFNGIIQTKTNSKLPPNAQLIVNFLAGFDNTSSIFSSKNKQLNWILNNSLENDKSIKITKTNDLPFLNGSDFSFYSK
uniref:Cadherin domain-containing protein n=1 Tax=Meloidogyne floridensis TaxID=298350 RepID=A0A915P3W2_9BILA